MKVYEYLKTQIKKDGAVHLVLIDPDKQEPSKAGEVAKASEKAGADGIMVGGSGGNRSMLDNCVKHIKSNCKLPVIMFPGNVNDISKYADAIYFMSLLNSRSNYWLSQAQALGAFAVREAKIEPIPMGYMIIQSDVKTAVEFFGDANPIPRQKPKIAAAYSLAAEYMGMKLVYLEGGSGAAEPVPNEMIALVKRVLSIPVVVGGGIRDGKQSYGKVKAGADIIVTGTAIEEADDPYKKLKDLIKGTKKAGKERLNG